MAACCGPFQLAARGLTLPTKPLIHPAPRTLDDEKTYCVQVEKYFIGHHAIPSSRIRFIKIDSETAKLNGLRKKQKFYRNNR
jgi:hypothetical protein